MQPQSGEIRDFMRILTKAQFLREKDVWLSKLRAGAVFMYPTDTIYGIGCDATNKQAVDVIRQAKQRDEKPFSVIAPSKKWIEENCIVSNTAKECLKKLPGPYTLLLPLLNKNAIAPNVIGTSQNIGVRIPKHWWNEFVAEFGKPLVTTSVNIAGQPHATSVWNVPIKLKEHIDFAIDDGQIKNPPSILLDCTSEQINEVKR
ncbi:MAG: threonylcarbamoyl-AMP synthase [Candidatus Aenigmarchaeota archaeon]|nr:threonylcarbamoyl-AMP synthase [Candidatus Aenigmarchaeota archaeon]